MAFFVTKITHSRLTFSAFTSEGMMEIAQSLVDHIKYRISRDLLDATDSPAKPLNVRYARGKVQGRYVALGGGTRYKGAPVRDWMLRGRTMQSLKVKTASEELATIGPTSRETYIIIAARNKRDNMWGVSPEDLAAMNLTVRSVLTRRPPVQASGTETITISAAA
jgi:hypothetical protein